MLDCLAVAFLLLPRVWLKFVLELRLGCLVKFLLWSAIIVLSDLVSRPLFPHHPVSLRCAFFARFPVRPVSVPPHSAWATSRLSRFHCVARCSPDFPSVTFPFRRAFLARLPVCPFVSPRIERIALSAPLLFWLGTVCSTTFSALWVVCFTDCLQCAVFGAFCVGFVCVDLVCLECAYNR